MPMSRRSARVRIGSRVSALLLGAALIGACSEPPRADPENAQQVALGQTVYEARCASCHGVQLEGQPNWRDRLVSGKLPAPPHDPSGHTWHHADSVLFGMTKYGVERYAPPGYQSDMPAFEGRLNDDEIWAVIAYIKSTWPSEIKEMQAEINRKARSNERN